MSAARRELTKWKQVAAYLHVTVRTAQTWELERDLPIHRLPGPKARIWAFTDELDAWREKQAPGAQPKPLFRLPAWLMIGALLTAAGLGVAFLLTRPGKPVRFTAEGARLRAFDESNREVWRYDLPRVPIPPVGGFDSYTDGHRGFLADLEKPGSAEFLYAFFDPRPAPLAAPLLCIGRNGQLRWSFQSGREVREASGALVSNNFWPAFVAVLQKPRPDGGRIGVVSHHRYTWPAQVAVLTSAGKVVAEYWHPGWFFNGLLYDLDGDGREEIILVGANNSYFGHRCQAAMVVLDADFRSGQSAPPAGDEHKLAGMPTVTEAAMVLFPTLPYPSLPGHTWIGVHVEALGTQLEVKLSGNAVPEHGSGTFLHYLLDRNLRCTSVTYDAALEQYYAAGMPPPAPGATREQQVKKALTNLLVPRNRFAGGR